MDALSYMLQAVRLRSTCYASVRLNPPWGVLIPRTDAAAFHAVVAGHCWLRLGDADQPVALAKGDVVVLPHGEAHTFFDAPGSPIRVLSPAAAGADRAWADAGAASVPHQPPGPPAHDQSATTVICGHLWFDDQMANPLVGMLPPLLHFRAAAGGRAAGWLEPVLQFVALENEVRTPGTDAALARLSDVIVIQAIRAHLARAASRPGRLAARARRPADRHRARVDSRASRGAVDRDSARLARRTVQIGVRRSLHQARRQSAAAVPDLLADAARAAAAAGHQRRHCPDRRAGGLPDRASIQPSVQALGRCRARQVPQRRASGDDLRRRST